MTSEEAWDKLKAFMDDNPDVYIHFYDISTDPTSGVFSLQGSKSPTVFPVFLRATEYISRNAPEIERSYGATREVIVQGRNPWQRRKQT